MDYLIGDSIGDSMGDWWINLAVGRLDNQWILKATKCNLFKALKFEDFKTFWNFNNFNKPKNLKGSFLFKPSETIEP